MDPATALMVMELVKIAVQATASFARLSGVTEEELKTMFDESFQCLKDRDPAKLPDI